MAQPPTHGFVQLPPDGTGKRLSHSVVHELSIGTTTGTPSVGEHCSFGTSGLVGAVSKVDVIAGGFSLHITLDEPIPDNVTAIVGEDFLQRGVKIGVVSNVGSLFYAQQNVLVGGSNNVNRLEIDDSGAAWVTYERGTPDFDAFGKMQVSEQSTIASYIHRYDTLDEQYTSVTSGTGTYTHDPNTSGVILSCGTDIGAKVSRTTDLYHPYQPGVSQCLIFTGSISDYGKPGVVRRGGLFDDENGLFFEMYETTFNVVLRSKSTGVVTETRVPSTEWNHDRMDGTGGFFNPSGIMLNPTTDNIYWIDYQWLGAGTIRFGVYVNGQRIVIHAIHNTNVVTHSYMTSGSLPFRYEQENIGASGSTSEFRVFCGTVQTEGAFTPRRLLYSTTVTKTLSSTASAPVLSLRPAQYLNGIPNRGTLYMYGMMLYNSGTDPVMVELQRGAASTGGTWGSAGLNSIAEVNNTITGYVGGNVNWNVVVPPNQMVQINVSAYDQRRQGFRRKADVTLAVEQVMTARLLSGTTGGDLTAIVSWDEVKV